MFIEGVRDMKVRGLRGLSAKEGGWAGVLRDGWSREWHVSLETPVRRNGQMVAGGWCKREGQDPILLCQLHYSPVGEVDAAEMLVLEDGDYHVMLTRKLPEDGQKICLLFMGNWPHSFGMVFDASEVGQSEGIYEFVVAKWGRRIRFTVNVEPGFVFGTVKVTNA